MISEISEITILTAHSLILFLWSCEDIEKRSVKSRELAAVLAVMGLRYVFMNMNDIRELALRTALFLAVAGGLAATSFMTRGGIGGADIIVALILYLYLGSSGFLVAGIVAVLAGAVLAVGLIAASFFAPGPRRMISGVRIPFIPFLFLGYAVGRGMESVI